MIYCTLATLAIFAMASVGSLLAVVLIQRIVEWWRR